MLSKYLDYLQQLKNILKIKVYLEESGRYSEFLDRKISDFVFYLLKLKKLIRIIKKLEKLGVFIEIYPADIYDEKEVFDYFYEALIYVLTDDENFMILKVKEEEGYVKIYTKYHIDDWYIICFNVPKSLFDKFKEKYNEILENIEIFEEKGKIIAIYKKNEKLLKELFEKLKFKKY